MNTVVSKIIAGLAYIILAPLIGGLLEGLDRKISARMQRRVGPPILQPFYDVGKLLHKQTINVTKSQSFLMMSYLIFMMITGVMFFIGTDILMCMFVMSTAAMFLYFAATVTSSPYSTIGASRELIQIMAYEPAVLLTCVGFYIVRKTFEVGSIIQAEDSAIKYLPGVFVAFVFVLTIKMRKSPFDISTSHHANQEVIKGVTAELGAKNLAYFQISEWYENVLLMGIIGLFIINSNLISIPIAIAVILLVYFLEILIDNCSARMKYTKMLFLAWTVTIIASGCNIWLLMMILD
ncbi:MAG: NADH-quinone oxidoreductase subunit H [Lachnospiraceae bacterium]|nr:NADH-quinone oxidoreductase subunit H [Lachnospiraceae bacterium]